MVSLCLLFILCLCFFSLKTSMLGTPCWFGGRFHRVLPPLSLIVLDACSGMTCATSSHDQTPNTRRRCVVQWYNSDSRRLCMFWRRHEFTAPENVDCLISPRNFLLSNNVVRICVKGTQKKTGTDVLGTLWLQWHHKSISHTGVEVLLEMFPYPVYYLGYSQGGEYAGRSIHRNTHFFRLHTYSVQEVIFIFTLLKIG